MRPIPAPYDEASPRSEETLFAVLAAAARRRSDGALAAWAGAGSIVAVAAGTALPRWRFTFLVAVCAAAFGLWGIVDRELGESAAAGATRSRRVRVLRIARGVIAFLGIAAGAAALLAGLGTALGTWIS